jgi:hypothetical protein
VSRVVHWQNTLLTASCTSMHRKPGEHSPGGYSSVNTGGYNGWSTELTCNVARDSTTIVHYQKSRLSRLYNYIVRGPSAYACALFLNWCMYKVYPFSECITTHLGVCTLILIQYACIWKPYSHVACMETVRSIAVCCEATHLLWIASDFFPMYISTD